MYIYVGPKRDEAAGWCRKLNNKDLEISILFTKYYYDNKINENEMGRACNLYFVLYNLFHDSDSVSHYIVSNSRIMGELRIRNDM
jgi:hypothetical protein